MENKDESFKILDITDPMTENQLEEEDSRFDLTVEASFDSDTVVRLLQAARKSPHVNELFLGYIEMDHEIAMALVDLFHEDRIWKRLTLQGCPDNITEVCTTLLVARGNIESMCIYQNDLEYHGFCSLGMILASNPKHLTTLDLDEYLLSEGAAALAEGLKRNQTLKVLDLHDCRFIGEAASLMAEGFRSNFHLQILQLSHCELGDNEVAELLESLKDHPAIEAIFVDCNYCGSKTSQALSSMLTDNRTPKLQKLSVRHQHDARSEFRTPDIQATLDIDTLSSSLSRNSCLQDLCLTQNRLNLQELATLMAGVKESDIRILHMDTCGITDEGVEIIVANLPSRLERLFLTDNLFSNETSEKHLLATIRTNTSLQHLHIGLDHSCRWEVDHYARLNRGGRRALSTSSNVPLGLWAPILARVNAIDWNTLYGPGKGFREDVIFFLLEGCILQERRFA